MVLILLLVALVVALLIAASAAASRQISRVAPPQPRRDERQFRRAHAARGEHHS
jgi:hypothetical protein